MTLNGRALARLFRMDQRRTFGNSGEALAAGHLERQGLRVLERQYRTNAGEIDLVAQDGEEIVFVEVKTRRGVEYGYPEAAVTRSKLNHIVAAGEFFLRERSLEAQPWRVDVIAIRDLPGGEPEIVHFRGVGLDS